MAPRSCTALYKDPIYEITVISKQVVEDSGRFHHKLLFFEKPVMDHPCTAVRVLPDTCNAKALQLHPLAQLEVS
ncbi:MAG: hypothetical protein JWM59_4574 [Verrucomicrobiales bacterium]|nr:hypothetical protein [Verrucomicrobiales bacterium]